MILRSFLNQKWSALWRFQKNWERSARNWILEKYPSLNLFIAHFRITYFRIKNPRSRWILTRTACLGNDVTKLAFPGTPRINWQKGRIDGLALLLRGQYLSPEKVPFRVKFLISQIDIWWLVSQQNKRLRKRTNPPSLIVLDSYSDLTDQLFSVSGTKSSFFANYSDVLPSAIEDETVVCHGLLPLGGIKSRYENFFDSVLEIWGPVRIALLTYPTTLEHRPKFIERALAIRQAFSELSDSRHNVHLVEVSDDFALPKPDEVKSGLIFPYHYHPVFYEKLANALREAAYR